jgi:hypothetical protein
MDSLKLLSAKGWLFYFHWVDSFYSGINALMRLSIMIWQHNLVFFFKTLCIQTDLSLANEFQSICLVLSPTLYTLCSAKFNENPWNGYLSHKYKSFHNLVPPIIQDVESVFSICFQSSYLKY